MRPTPGDPWSVEQHHWNTGAEENQQLNPGGIHLRLTLHTNCFMSAKVEGLCLHRLN